MSIDQQISDAFEPVSTAVSDVIFFSVPVLGADLPLIVVWLISAGFFFTGYTKFIQVRGFRHAVSLVRGNYDDPDDIGEVTHFQALATAVSGTVGLGNIAGVAVAISIGGPGATLWMIAAGLLGMCTKFAECTLGVKFRREFPDGTVSGGPMHYLRRGLEGQGKRGLGVVLAFLFAVFTIFASLGGGNMFQSNQAFSQMRAVTGGDDGFLGGGAAGALFGLGLAILVGVVIIGGIKSIAKVTGKLVPFMAVFYVLSCLLVLALNVTEIPSAFGSILTGAFSPEGVTGGAIGALIQGIRRAAFSNEAGIGSAAIAHSAVKTKHPVTEGYVGLLEPFIDTVVVCTMTALVIVITGVYEEGQDVEGVQLTSDAFATVVGWFPVVLAIAVALFAFSTMLAWSYYGVKATTYLFGESKIAENVYKVIFCIFVVIGATGDLGAVIDFSDAAIFAMSLPNILGLYLMAGVIKSELNGYEAQLADGGIPTAREREAGMAGTPEAG